MDKKIKLLALDVDGTLITPDQQVPQDVVDAIAAAQAAGLRVCLATGRSIVETTGILQQLPPPAGRKPEPVVTLGGALIVEPCTGRTLYQKPIPCDLASVYADALVEAGHCAMGIVDRWRNGFDYLFVQADDFGQAHRMWFDKMPESVVIREVDSFKGLETDLLRINAVVNHGDSDELEQRMKDKFGESLHIHSIYAPNYDVYVVEAFAVDCNKWTALKYLAQSYRIGPGGVAAVGDDVNDLPMLQEAGTGVAMPTGSQSAKDAADIVAEAGLAAFIYSLL